MTYTKDQKQALLTLKEDIANLNSTGLHIYSAMHQGSGYIFFGDEHERYNDDELEPEDIGHLVIEEN